MGYDRWDDTSEAALAKEAARIRANIHAAKARFDYTRLDPSSQLQYRVFLDEQQLLLDRYRWREHFYALNQIVGLHVDIPGTLTGAQPLESEEDARAYVKRIAAVRVAMSRLVQHLRTQAKHGIFMPKPVYPLLIEGARNVITGAPHDTGPDGQIFADFKRRVALLDIPAERKARWVEEAREALRNDLQPAYEQLIGVLQDQGEHTPILAGVWQIPDGDTFYAFLVRQFTTTAMTPEDVHTLGLRQVEAVHTEIAAVTRTLDSRVRSGSSWRKPRQTHASMLPTRTRVARSFWRTRARLSVPCRLTSRRLSWPPPPYRSKSGASTATRRLRRPRDSTTPAAQTAADRALCI